MQARVSATFLIVCFALQYAFTPAAMSGSSENGAHKPAVFTDPGRAEKVKTTATAVEGIFKKFFEDRHLPGLVYGVVLDGKLVYSGGFGYANLEQKTPAQAQSLFRIASMSKSITALAILQLRDAGKLRLDEPASKYIPEMKKLRYLTKDAPEITIRHLLTHGAGFPEDNPWGDRQLADSDEELRQLIANGPSFSNVPGVAFEYSNLGFALLGQIVQKVSGMEFQQYTMANIFKPLGMNATVWEYEKAEQKKLALGYNWIDESHVDIPLEHHGSYGAMGGLITSIEDFTQYVALHLAAWPPRDEQESGVLKRSSLREMHHPWRLDAMMPNYRYPNGRACPSASAYGYGLRWVRDCESKTYIGHSGGLPGFGSNWTMMPDYGLAVMAFDNITYGGTSTINTAVLDTIITLAKLKPRALPVSDILEQRKNELVKIFPDWNGAERSGLFAENFFKDNRVKDLAQRTKELYEEAGEITNVGAMSPLNQLRGTFLLLGKKKNLEIFFTLTPEKSPLIQQLRMRAVEKMAE
ncbi:beta-lactamase family protein [candidate division KSB1 bacterium]|nr:beta-lactamase family protein [candidate division KSB1 bacterium]